MQKKKKILVVDDEADILDLLTNRLKANNYDVVTAVDGEDALDKLSKERPDAILLDIMMPRIGGLDVLKKIRETDKDLPIFMITAYSNEERFKIANQFNASGFIIKSDDFQTQIEQISSIINVAEKHKK
ncbi:MAG TPA: response regulator [Candidatus Omnitrophota bacterium]|nr:response regulator [Candidatus Omnitrophota bacterium]